MSGRAFDHIVLAVHDLDRAAATYEALGFTLTPRAQHEDRMGTSNRLAQFAGRSFIEILEVDRPGLLAPHDPPFFGFGAHNKAFLESGEGVSMLVFATDDSRADIARFAAEGIPTYDPFDFERQATLPDGSGVTVAFSLGFATSPDMPRIAFFTCQNRVPEAFWKPAFQSHANGTRNIRAVILTSPDPARDAAFIGRMFGGAVRQMEDWFSVACGPEQEVRVVPDTSLAPEAEARFTGIVLRADTTAPRIEAVEAHGISIDFEMP